MTMPTPSSRMFSSSRNSTGESVSPLSQAATRAGMLAKVTTKAKTWAQAIRNSTTAAPRPALTSAGQMSARVISR